MGHVLPLSPAWGIFIVRIATGLLFAVHGWQKFAGGIGGVIGFFAKIGIPAPGVTGPFIQTRVNSFAARSMCDGI